MAERPYHHGNLRTALLGRPNGPCASAASQELSLRELAREVGRQPRRATSPLPRSPGAARRARRGRLRAPRRRAARRGRRRRRGIRGPAAAPRPRPTSASRPGRSAARADVRGQAPRADGALHEAAERAFAVMLELIAQGQAEGVLRARGSRARRPRPVRDDPGDRRARHRRHRRARADRRARRRRDRHFLRGSRPPIT